MLFVDDPWSTMSDWVVTITTEYMQEAHLHSVFHKNEILQSAECGCFHCATIFQADEVQPWVDEAHPKGATALCPKCGIDAVIGSASGFPISDPIFLSEMREYWF